MSDTYVKSVYFIAKRTACRDEEVVLAEYPAVKVVRPDLSAPFLAGDHFQIFDTRSTFGSEGGIWREFSIGSVLGGCEEYNDDPYESLERAKSNGHPIQWVYPTAVGITSHKVPQQTLVGVYEDDVIKFEGREFVLLPASNGHYNLKVVTPEADNHIHEAISTLCDYFFECNCQDDDADKACGEALGVIRKSL